MIFVGTVKGAFLVDGSKIEGPLFKGWKVTTSARDEKGRTFVGLASDVYGASIQVSDDLKKWRQIEKGPAYPEGGPKMKQIWTIRPGATMYAGVDEAGLFESADRGESWKPVPSLNDHPTRKAWYPGAGGLCAHVVLTAGSRVWVGISAVGVWRSDDSGKTWAAKNAGVPAVVEDKEHKDIGFCVHGLVQDPAKPDHIWRQDHAGVFRSRNGGDTWERIETGLPSRFGFPIARHDGALYVIPQESDEYRMAPEGRLRVYRSRDGGDHWEPMTDGLPQANAFTGVLRGAMDVDTAGGVHFGTTGGTLYLGGKDRWEAVKAEFPRILSVRAY